MLFMLDKRAGACYYFAVDVNHTQLEVKIMHNKVREERTKAGLSQDALAKKASISRPFLSSIENGAAIPTIKTATAIAVALGKTLDEIFSDHE